eukprot:PITA_25062
MADAGIGLTNSQLAQFNGKNHSDWSIKMKALFASQGIWELVETGYAEPADETTLATLTVAKRDQSKSDKKKDSKAFLFLFQSVHESVFSRIAAATKSKEAWDIIKTSYQGMEKVKTPKLQMLRRDFETLSMKEFDTIDSFFTQAIEETKDLSQFTVDELSASLMSHEHTLSRGTYSSFEQAFKTQMSLRQRKGRGRATNRGRGRSQYKGKYYPASTSGRSCNQNQDQGSSKQQAHGQRYDKSQLQCHYSKKYGHYANECRKKQNVMNSRQNVNFANEENKNQKNVLLTCNIAQDKQEDVWFLDSGCSNHMTGNIAMFANLDKNVKSEVTIGTDSKIPVKGKGSVSIRARNGEQMFVPDVYYVPGLKCNLLSIGQLIDKGYNVFFKDDMCTIRAIPPSKKIIAQVQMTSNRMFPLKLRADLNEGRTVAAVTQEVFQEQVKDENWLWHLRFGHLNFRGLNLLHRKGMKSEVFEKFRHFKTLVEKQCGHYIKVLRTDRGGEYISLDFLHFRRENGIQKQITATYTSQQNGVAKRKNRTILDMVRSMLKAKHLPHEYWAEAVTCVFYILNRCPTKVVLNRILEEAWSGQKKTLTHMRVFGCVAYAHFIDDEAWDGSLDKTVNVKTIVSHEEEQEGTSVNNPSLMVPPPPQQIQQTTPQTGIRTALRSQGSASPSTPQGSEIPSSSDGTPSTPRIPRFRNLNEIYEQGDVSTNTGLNSLFALYCHVDDPVHFEDVLNEHKWIEAMNEEIGAIEKSKTWELVDLPEGKKAIGVKWVYKTKSNAEGKIDRHKERLVVKGYK